MKSPIVTAILHPLAILMMVTAVGAGLLSAWWLFPIGLLIWAVMVVMVSRDKALGLNYQMQQRAPLAARFQRYFDRVERAQVSIFNTIASAPPTMRRILQPVHTAVDSLTQEAYGLCQRMTALENYRVVTQSQTDLTLELAQIERVIEATTDPVVRRDYEDSRQALKDRLAKLQSVATHLDRVEALLMSLANDMDAIVTEVVRLQAMGTDNVSGATPQLVQRLQAEAQELRTFEQQATRAQLDGVLR